MGRELLEINRLMISGKLQYHRSFHPWEDMRFPAAAINPPGVAADPDWSTTENAYAFAPSGTEILFGIGQMPHAYASGTAIRPHFHGYGLTAPGGNDQIVWQLELMVYGFGEIVPSSFTYDETVTFTVPAAARQATVISFPEVDMTGKGESDTVKWKLSRLGGDASDTYASDFIFDEFDLHYQQNKPGTYFEYFD